MENTIINSICDIFSFKQVMNEEDKGYEFKLITIDSIKAFH